VGCAVPVRVQPGARYVVLSLVETACVLTYAEQRCESSEIVGTFEK
jgi:hypothetical protein